MKIYKKFKKIVKKCYKITKNVSFRLISGPVIGLIIGSIGKSNGLDKSMYYCLGITAWMIIYWLNEVVRMGLTALLPIAVFPLFGIVSGSETSSLYFSDGVVVCWGSMLMATAIEKYGLHSRFANYFLHRVSAHNFPGLLLVFIFATGNNQPSYSDVLV